MVRETRRWGPENGPCSHNSIPIKTVVCKYTITAAGAIPGASFKIITHHDRPWL